MTPKMATDKHTATDELSREDMLENALQAVKRWLAYHLENNVIGRSTGKGGHDGNGTSWAAAAIPDWDVRQKIEEIESALKKAESQP